MNDDGFININANETVIAKFFMAQDLPLKGIKKSGKSLYREFSLGVNFPKSNNAFVDGLTLITSDIIDIGYLLSKYAVPWGNNHKSRSR